MELVNLINVEFRENKIYALPLVYINLVGKSVGFSKVTFINNN